MVWDHLLGPMGDFYNETMQEAVGDYRFSDTLGEIPGVDEHWLDGLHDSYDAYRERKG